MANGLRVISASPFSGTIPLNQGFQTTINQGNSSDISTEHPVYSALKSAREKCRDVISGQEAVKAKKEKYLPRLSGQKDDEYAAYVQRALFFSIGAKSLQALVGMASLKLPKIVATASMTEKYFDFSSNVQFDSNFTAALSEVLLQNQAGVLVDWPKNGGDASISVYPAESIINWDYDDDGNLTQIVLREIQIKKTDRYTKVQVNQYRELYIDKDGIYKQRVIVDGESSSPIEIIPEIKGQPYKSIPFVPFHSRGIGFTTDQPLLLDIANVNLSHYNTSADLEHGRHFTGLPTPIITGAKSDTDLYIGSNRFIVLPDNKAKADYLEFTGQGLQSLENAMVEKQSMLASLSARLIDNSSKGSEATEAVKLRYLSETASLTTVVKTINVVLNKVYNIIAESLSIDGESVEITLNTDFLGTQMPSSDMTALFDAYIAGSIDVSTLVYNLREGQRLSPNESDDDIMKQIELRTAQAQKASSGAEA